ncbi:hypothetical protein [Alloscardovia criceti]|uniref:hypothetical protein n=1 Tax=Alloscardovia criceti TaxID=356828 RepID=UPI0003659680|nr:hypothetical protein [Alloscardovia criceti]
MANNNSSQNPYEDFSTEETTALNQNAAPYSEDSAKTEQFQQYQQAQQTQQNANAQAEYAAQTDQAQPQQSTDQFQQNLAYQQQYASQNAPQGTQQTSIPVAQPMAPNTVGGPVNAEMAPNKAERKKMIMHIAIGFVAAAALITPTTWMIASSTAQNSGPSMSSQMNMQGGPGGQMMGPGGSTSSDGSTDSQGSTDGSQQFPGANGSTSDGSSSDSSSSSTTNSSSINS